MIIAQEEWTPHAKCVLDVKADVAIHAPKEYKRFLTHRMKFGGESSADSQVNGEMAWEEQLSWLGSSAGFELPRQCQRREPSTLVLLDVGQKERGHCGLKAVSNPKCSQI